MNNTYLKGIFEQFDTVTQNIKTSFGELNEAQLNWKSHPKEWSIGQCLDHLIVTNNQYSKTFHAFANGTKTPNFFEKRGWLSNFWAKELIKATLPKVNKKTKTFQVFEPTQSNIRNTIVTDFVKENERFKSLILDMDNLNHQTTIMSSPVSKLIVYSLKNACIILANHEERHYNQAMNMMSHHKFPKSK